MCIQRMLKNDGVVLYDEQRQGNTSVGVFLSTAKVGPDITIPSNPRTRIPRDARTACTNPKSVST